MRKLSFFFIAQYMSLLSLFAQVNEPRDSSNYEDRRLGIEEINFVSGYYHQNGNNSGVTGGTGTEKLTDIANSLELRLSRTNLRNARQTLSLELGIDTYTSASSDNIDMRNSTISGPSSRDVRVYPSVNWTSENAQKTTLWGAGLSYSHEFDYISRGLNLNFVKSSANNNREFGVKLFVFFDKWGVLYPYELRPVSTVSSASSRGEHPQLDYKPRNSYQASFSLSQVITPRLQVALMFDPSYQSGQLSTLYQRVYFTNGSEKIENLPGTRLKLPIGARANYFLGDRLVLRGFYRYYTDDWGNIAHTANLEVPVKITPFFSISPFYRYHKQSGIDYFAAYKAHKTSETYFTSDYDLSPLSSQFMGAGIHIAPPRGVFGHEHFNALDIRFGHYIRHAGSGLIGNTLSLALKFK